MSEGELALILAKITSLSLTKILFCC